MQLSKFKIKSHVITCKQFLQSIKSIKVILIHTLYIITQNRSKNFFSEETAFQIITILNDVCDTNITKKSRSGFGCSYGVVLKNEIT